MDRSFGSSEVRFRVPKRLEKIPEDVKNVLKNSKGKNKTGKRLGRPEKNRKEKTAGESEQESHRWMRGRAINSAPFVFRVLLYYIYYIKYCWALCCVLISIFRELVSMGF